MLRFVLQRRFRWGVVAFVVLAFTVLTGHVLAQTPTPQASGLRVGSNPGFTESYTEYLDELDDFWRNELTDMGFRYSSPSVTQVTTDIDTNCGRMFANDWNAYYCPGEQAIFLFPRFMDMENENIGDYAPMFIVAHEWGHHAQHVAGIAHRGADYELQADCLGGVFSRYAEQQGWLDRGDIIEGLELAESVGDDAFAQDTDDPHGTFIERRDAVMRGLLDGFAGCSFPGSASQHTPSAIPTRTAITPTPVPSPKEPRLPTSLSLDHASCFSIVDDGQLTFSQLLERFSGFSDASGRLQGWGWQASAFRQFGCDNPPDGEAGWIDISVHEFSSAESAQEAADYFVAARIDGTSLRRADGPGIGDYSVALIGPATNGTEFTVYATRGPWLVRVTGVSPSGIPFMNVRTVAIDVLEAQDLGGAPRSPSVPDPPSSAPSLPSETYLPSVPEVPHAACFRTEGRGPNRYQDVVAAFVRTGAGPDAIETYGWQDGAWIVFKCADPPPGRAKQIDISIHQFRDVTAAQQVASIVEDFQIPGAHESRDCSVAGTLVICVTGYADSGTPAADVRFVLNQVVASAR